MTFKYYIWVWHSDFSVTFGSDICVWLLGVSFGCDIQMQHSDVASRCDIWVWNLGVPFWSSYLLVPELAWELLLTFWQYYTKLAICICTFMSIFILVCLYSLGLELLLAVPPVTRTPHVQEMVVQNWEIG